MGAAKRRQEAQAQGCPYHQSIATIEAPSRVRALPLDARGFPVPHFVAWIDGQPDHRIMDGPKLAPAIKHKLCWICGQPLGKTFAFTIGPMCAINRIISEPPSHRECAEYAVKACPFLSRPQAHRRVAGMPDAEEHGLKDSAGVGLKRNPGVTVIWITQSYKPFRVSNGVLFQLGDPLEVNWWCEGREATRAEAVHSIYTGLPSLIEIASKQGRDAEDALAGQVSRIPTLLPPEQDIAA